LSLPQPIYDYKSENCCGKSNSSLFNSVLQSKLKAFQCYVPVFTFKINLT